MKRREGLDEYVRLPADGSKGETWDYRGPSFLCPVRGPRFVRLKLLLCGLSLLEAACAAAMGLSGTPGFRTLYGTLPFLALLYFAGRTNLSAFALLFAGRRLTRRRHARDVMGFRSHQRLLLLCCLLLLAGEAAFALGGGSAAREAPVFLAAAGLLAAGLLALRVHGRLPFPEAPPGDPDDFPDDS